MPRNGKTSIFEWISKIKRRSGYKTVPNTRSQQARATVVRRLTVIDIPIPGRLRVGLLADVVNPIRPGPVNGWAEQDREASFRLLGSTWENIFVFDSVIRATVVWVESVPPLCMKVFSRSTAKRRQLTVFEKNLQQPQSELSNGRFELMNLKIW